MAKLYSFLLVTLDGYYAGPNDEFDWPNVGEEFVDFAVNQNAGVDTLLFGRVTYLGMADFWTQPEVIQNDPIAAFMNSVPKVVFSSSLEKADWNNSTLVTGDPGEAIKELRDKAVKDLALFGSPTFTMSLLDQGLVDELRVMVNPILLGGGKSLFTGLARRVPLRLVRTTTFSSGNVLLTYHPIRD